ncbi:lipid-binding SYLF domain-containing protein [Campylobacter gastrosuis]|uniref:Lipid-binding SYLF domain-containing protein n=1 Tax=Campylobacter gastrosuis TaxID=2974576 RepID=A0ABT7HNX8_9BACT|nr:lipid-binding SYLF domain-containing protein [Campylobacter gastrosuis]MDL0088118.1 lipid-binding SYLF domain-containing protein [Campylobacter gastrosuis]
MRSICKIFFAVSLLFGVLNADVTQNQMVKNAINIMSGFLQNVDSQKLKDVKGVIVIPDLVKSGIGLALSNGKGVFIAKNDDGGWSSPFFIDYHGVSAGIQAGYSSTDVVILLRNSRAYKKIFEGDDTISLKATAAIINKGESAATTTNLPEISAYISERGKSAGAFVGASLDIARVSINRQDTNDYYDRMYDYQDLYSNSIKNSKYTTKLHEILNF